MDSQSMGHMELRVSYRYIQEHPWVVQAMTGFLSAYFMETPGFRVQRHFEELESGMHVWLCDVPSTMKVLILLRRLQEDIPPASTSRSPRITRRERNTSSIVLESNDRDSPAEIAFLEAILLIARNVHLAFGLSMTGQARPGIEQRPEKCCSPGVTGPTW